MRSRPHRCWKDFGRIHKSSRVWSEIEKELRHRIEEDKRSPVVLDGVVSDGENGENYGEHEKAHYLDGFAAPAVYKGHREKVTRYVSAYNRINLN